MKGVSQSYNAKDCSLYRNVKFMQDILDQKDDDLAMKHDHHDHEGHDDIEKKLGEKININDQTLNQYDSNTELVGIFKND